ncbi:MAG: helix-turn-helix transcriptional regulator [Clostridia bacterium]|nr:helix-turn-helix transcriptional regulator [Clostridia bacterium]
MTFGEKIQQLRKEQGFSQELLAEKMGVTRQTISKWELDQSTPELEYIATLSDLFKVTTDYLIKNGQPRTPQKCEMSDSKESSHSESLIKSIFPYILGVLLLTIGGVVVVTLILLSVIYPHSALINGQNYEGLLGFLLGRKCLILFALALCSALTGGVLTIRNFFKMLKTPLSK